MTQNHLFGDNDCNRSLGIRYEHLQSETPPNPFLYPRSLFRLQENTGIHPVLATHPPQLVQHFQPNPILESCAGKFVMSAAMGVGYLIEFCIAHWLTDNLSGYVMGNLFGVVLGSYEGMAPPIPIPGQREAPKVPWKESVWRNEKIAIYYDEFDFLDAWSSSSDCRQVPLLGQQFYDHLG